MATAAKTLESKIMNYLKVLNADEKKTILSVVETFAKVHEDEWSEKQKAELDQRQADYKSGKTKMITASESKKRIQKLIRQKLK